MRSRKLLEVVRASGVRIDPGQGPRQAEDVLLCRQHRVQLESSGIAFAPISVARRFSYETGTPPPASLGFHNTFNFPLFFREDELLEFAAEIINRQTDMSILLIYLHRLAHCGMHDLLRLSVETIHARPSVATVAIAQARAMAVHDSVVRALEGRRPA